MSISDVCLRTGLVGVGHWGPNLARNLANHSRFQLSWVCDTDSEKLERVAPVLPRECGRCTDLDVMLNDPLLDAVVIATPASSHVGLVQRALAANKHVLCEKPMGFCGQDVQGLFTLAETRNRHLMVGFTFLFNDAVRKVRELLEKQGIGVPYYTVSTRTHMGLVRQDVSAMWDLAPHDVAITNYLLGESPKEVAVQAAHPLGTTCHDVAFITLRYPSGVLANIHVSWADSNKVRTTQLVGSRARVVFDDLDNQEPVRIFEKGIGVSRQVEADFGNFRYLLTDGDIISPRVRMEEPLKNMIGHFASVVLDRVPNICGPDSTMAVIATLEAADRSLAMNGTPQPVVFPRESKFRSSGGMS